MPSPTNKYSSLKSQPSRHYLLSIVLLLWLALILFAATNVRNILDYISLAGYTPPKTVSQLISEDTMTAQAAKIFKVNHPLVESKSTFNTNCPNDGGEKTIVLGCYHSNQKGIFILGEYDPRLNGVEQVTAAHEMLHAAYDRLDNSTKARVDKMLLSYFNTGLTNQRIKDELANYRKTEPGQVVNEMHSIFGTEISSLPAGLEAYYKQYFTDRQKIAGYANQYQSVFTSIKSQVSQFDQQLSDLKSQINALEVDAKAKEQAISDQQATLNNEKSSNPNAYNAAVPGYNAEVDAYTAEINQINGLIGQYNALVAQRNNIALTENQLYQELGGVQHK